MLYLIEGPKNCGKSYLLENSRYGSFKFPFISYFKKFIAKDDKDTGSQSKEAYHFSTSFDVSILSMEKSGIIVGTVLVDRGFLSNVVLGELQGRITHQQGLDYIDWLASENLLDVAPTIYIDKKDSGAGRTTNKDDWEFLGYDAQKAKYEEYFKYLKDRYNYTPVRFTNDFNGEETVKKFDSMVFEMENKWFRKELRSAFGLDKVFNSDFLDKIFK